jgi:hypothetical protein
LKARFKDIVNWRLTTYVCGNEKYGLHQGNMLISGMLATAATLILSATFLGIGGTPTYGERACPDVLVFYEGRGPEEDDGAWGVLKK